MKADVKLTNQREKEAIEWATNFYRKYAEHDTQALEWAINFFRGCEAELKGDRSPRDIGELYLLMRGSLRRLENDGERDGGIYADHLRALGRYLGARLDRGDKFEHFVDWERKQIINLLRNPNLLESRSAGAQSRQSRLSRHENRGGNRLHHSQLGLSTYAR
jgi:hypothetical protein